MIPQTNVTEIQATIPHHHPPSPSPSPITIPHHHRHRHRHRHHPSHITARIACALLRWTRSRSVWRRTLGNAGGLLKQRRSWGPKRRTARRTRHRSPSRRVLLHTLRDLGHRRRSLRFRISDSGPPVPDRRQPRGNRSFARRDRHAANTRPVSVPDHPRPHPARSIAPSTPRLRPATSST